MLCVALVGVASLALVASATADVVTNSSDDMRTGWYPDEGSITPSLVSGPTWGQLWSAQVSGQVYAQPLLAPSGTLVVTTETDNVYGLDPASGAARWSDTNLAPNGPWNPADVGCSDIVPSRGSTSTPVIDTSTNTVYLTYKTYDSSHNAVWYMDALDVTTGQNRSGFPVQLSGTADNDASLTFDAKDEDQRPGLLLMNGVVYAGFGSTCDKSPFQGWVFGVSTSGQITARWASVTNGGDGGGVWQSGVGLSSDSPGSILIATGNGGAPSVATPGNSPPSSCGECVMRLDVQPDGTLKPVDFFAPFDAAQLDQFDTDFGSGGVVGLPEQPFGTSSVPHVAVVAGKEGYVYLLNLDALGGYDQGAGQGDDVVQRLGPSGAVFGRPGVWPGDGGYVYLVTECCQDGGGTLDVYQNGQSASGDPSLSEVATSSDVFGFGSGSPVITSDGTNSGSALVWVIWAANRNGNGGQLRAYNPVPVNGQPQQVWSASIGNATNYSTPGVGAGRLYVGTRDGTVVAFGSPVTSALGGTGLSFPRTTIGSSNQQSLTITANKTVTVSSLTSSDPREFTLGTPTPSLPVTLTAGQQLSVPVTFNPNQTGTIGGQVTAGTSAGNVSFSLSGTGQVNGPSLAASTPILSLGGTSIGGTLSGSVIFSNVGSQPVSITNVHPPAAPFSSPDLSSANGTQLAPGASVTVNISFTSPTGGRFTPDKYTFGLDSNGGDVSVGLSASAGTPGDLQFSSQAIDFGSTTVGTTATKSFTITNTGQTAVTIEKSKPPYGGAFAPTTTLPEASSIAPGQTVTESVTYSPTATGGASGVWQITGDDITGAHQVQFTGAGVPPSSGSQGGGPGTKPPPAKRASLPVAPKFLPAVVTTTRLASVYITYTGKLAGVSRFVLERAVVGRRGAHGCVASTGRNRSQPTCTRFVAVASFEHRGHAGANRLRLGAFVPLRKLAAGRYRLQSVLLDSAGGKHTFDTPLRIITPPRRHGSRDVAPPLASVGSLLSRLDAVISLL